MFSRSGNKRPVETFLVVKASQALFNTGSATANITDLTGGTVPKGTTRLADGQLGVFDATGYGSNAINAAITSGNTPIHSPVLYIAAGLPKDAVTNEGTEMPYPLWRRPFERSGDINSKNPIVATYQAYVAPENAAWVTGNPIGVAGEINIIDETDYVIQIGEHGYFNDIYYGSTGTNTITGSFTTPNYTALGTTNPVDHLVQNIAYDFNKNARPLNMVTGNGYRGNNLVVAFAITPDASAGAAIAGLTAGDVVTVVDNVNMGGTITMTAPIIKALQDAVASDSDWSGTAPAIFPIDLSAAGTNAAGASAEGIIFVSFDRTPAYKDKIPFLKSNIEVGLAQGFDFASVYNEVGNYALEGQGTYRQVTSQYNATHNQRLYNLSHTEDPIIEFPSPFVTTALYNQYVIEHNDINQIDSTNISGSPLKTIVCVPNTETTFVTAFTNLMNSWLNGGGHPSIEVV